MRAVVYQEYGDPAVVLRLGERPVADPRPGEVRVKTSFAAIHNHDLATVRGIYGVRPQLPAIGGTEAAGVVDAVGEGVTHLKVGQRVAGFAHSGAWAESFVMAASGALPLPEAITDEQGCQLVAMPISAMALLRTYKVENNQFLAQNTANGAVGKVLALLAKEDGINVLHLVRSEDAVKELEALGVTHVVSTADEGWKKKARALAGGAEIVYGFDSIGGKGAGQMLSILSDKGTLVAFGSMTGEPMEVDTGDMIFRQKKIEGFWLSRFMPAQSPADMGAMIGDLVKKVATGVIKLPVAGVYGFEQAAEAASASVRASRHGKVLFRAHG